MKYSLVEHPWIKALSERLPSKGRVARIVRAMGKAFLSGKTVVREKRVIFEGVEDAILERHLTVGPGPGEVLVETIYSAVSPGTERAYYLDLPNFHQERPYGPGYSGCGRIRTLGRSVTGLEKGALVAGLLKHSSRNVVAVDSLQILPSAVEPRDAAFTTLGVIALCGIRAAGDIEGRRIAVVGQGILGQLAVQMARVEGAAEIIAVALGASKRGLTEQSGVDGFIQLNQREEPLSSIEADVVIDVTGSLRGFENSLEMVKPSGRVVMLGSIAAYAEESEWVQLVVSKGIEVRGAHVRNLAAEGLSYRDEAARFLQLLAEEKLKLGHLITDIYTPEGAPEIFSRLTTGDRGMVGVLIDWQGLSPRVCC